jgi:hypothetical protein
VLELLYTEDASETELTMKSGSVDVGLGIDVMRVLRAYAKADPLIGANTGPAVSVLDSLDRRSRPILVSTERNRSMSHALKLATLIPRTEAPGSMGREVDLLWDQRRLPDACPWPKRQRWRRFILILTQRLTRGATFKVRIRTNHYSSRHTG